MEITFEGSGRENFKSNTLSAPSCVPDNKGEGREGWKLVEKKRFHLDLSCFQDKMSFQDVDRRRSSRKCWPFRARTTCTRNKQDTNGNFFHPQLLWRPALPPIIGDTTRRLYDIRFGRCPRQRFSIPHPSSVRISGGSIPNPKNRESIHFGYFGQ